uniref:SEC14-like lipid binding 7 n=1 Tax=Cyprinus carpio TaxID=7962 RepID=A0A8C2BGI4_CYPCA
IISSENVISPESGEKFAQNRKTVQSSSKQICWWILMWQKRLDFFTGVLLWIMAHILSRRDGLKLKCLNDGFVSHKLRGLLVDYYDVFISCLDSHSDGTIHCRGSIGERILTMFEENYPENLKKVLLIKCELFNNKQQKIAVLGSNWKEVLRNYVDADQLPAVYGGSMTDPDGNPLCKTMLRYGGVVPKSYYVRDSIKVKYDQFITISRGSSYQLDYEVLFLNCILRWTFASEGSDIGFGLFLKTKGNETKKVEAMQEILPTERYNSHLVPEDGSYTCEESGIYVVRFDNTYSVLHSKKVSFTVDVLLPEGHTGKQS